MIIKNEEQRLPRALDSLRAQPSITEIVVLDTGSTDRSVEIAKDYGCKVIEGATVLYMTADETPDGLPRIDFGACRNRARSHATGQWLFTMDGDEEVEGDVDLLCQYAIDRGGNCAAIWVTAHRDGAPMERFVQPRMLKNDGSIRWKYPIHNQKVGIIEPVGVSGAAEVLSDYGGEGRLEAKHARSRPMLLKLHQECPEDPHAAWFLLRMAESVQDWDEVERWADVLFDLMDPADLRWAQVAMALITGYTIQGDDRKTDLALHRLLKAHPHHPDGRYAVLVAAFRAWVESLDKGANYFGMGQRCHPFTANVGHVAAMLGVKI